MFAKLLGLETIENVLVVDDSPQKNLLNDIHSVVYSPTWFGDDEDRFITMQLQLWLEGLFRLSEVVTRYVKRAPLPGGQLPEDQKSNLAIKILGESHYSSNDSILARVFCFSMYFSLS